MRNIKCRVAQVGERIHHKDDSGLRVSPRQPVSLSSMVEHPTDNREIEVQFF